MTQFNRNHQTFGRVARIVACAVACTVLTACEATRSHSKSVVQSFDGAGRPLGLTVQDNTNRDSFVSTLQQFTDVVSGVQDVRLKEVSIRDGRRGQ